MKHLAALAVIAAGLAACQTTAPKIHHVALTAPTAPQSVRPIDRAITLGSEPVSGAMLQEVRRVVIRDRGQSGLLTIEGRSIADSSRAGRFMDIRLSVIDADITTAGIEGGEAARLRSLLGATSGDVIEYRLDMPSGLASITTTHQGSTTARTSEVELGFLALLRLPNFGGQKVEPGRDLVRYRFGDVFPTIAPGQADLAYSARPIGETVHNGRLAIVVQTSGAIRLDGQPFQIAGLILIDRATGAALWSETRLASMTRERQAKEITITQSLTLR